MKRLIIILLACISFTSSAQILIGKSKSYISKYVGDSAHVYKDSVTFTTSDCRYTCLFDSTQKCTLYYIYYPLEKYEELLSNFDKNLIKNGAYWISGNHQHRYTLTKSNRVVVKVTPHL